MEFKIETERLSRTVNIIASSFSRKYDMDFSDLVGEIWCHLCEKNPDNMALATAIIQNKCRDELRKKINKPYVLYDFATERMMDDERLHKDLLMDLEFSEDILEKKLYEDVESIAITHDLIKGIKSKCKSGEKAYIYAVAKAYITDGIDFLESEFKAIFDELPMERKKMLFESKKEYTADTILKIFVGIPTGGNAGSGRKIIADLKDYFMEYAGCTIR